MIYIIPILTALLYRMAGGGLIISGKEILPGIPKWLWFALMIGLTGILTEDIWPTLAWGLTFACLRFPPTQGLFSTFNGHLPTRKDAWYWPMAYVADGLEPVTYGLVYGFQRGLVCIPGVIALYASGIAIAPLFMAVFVSQGFIYYLSGRIGGESYGSTIAELSLGLLLGGVMII